ncbi:DUF4262 domain-containing protein [Flavobacterium pedocola]
MSEKYHSKVEENVAKYGFHITYVLEDEAGPSFCYSTGLYKNYNIPEIFISGLPQNLSFTMVGDYAKKFKNIIVPINKKLDSFSEDFNFPIYFIEIDNKNLSEHVYATDRFYDGDDYKYLQLIYPDTKGNFPNESGYLYNQEIFGELI